MRILIEKGIQTEDDKEREELGLEATKKQEKQAIQIVCDEKAEEAKTC